MVSRRKFLLAGGASVSAGAALWALGGTSLGISEAEAAIAEMATSGETLGPAPTAFLALADELSGHIGIDRTLVNRIYHVLSGVVHDLNTATDSLSGNLGQLKSLPLAQRLASLDVGPRDLFMRMTGALYNGTIDIDGATRQCVGFETLASHDVTADYVRPPSYCVGSPNFWVAPPTLTGKQEQAHG